MHANRNSARRGNDGNGLVAGRDTNKKRGVAAAFLIS
jgi:hypothetical protein